MYPCLSVPLRSPYILKMCTNLSTPAVRTSGSSVMSMYYTDLTLSLCADH